MTRFEEVKNLVMSLESDFEKFYEKENQAAGTRVRKGMQDLKTLAQDIRSEVQDKKNEAADKA
ncbi:MAG: histone H1 [Bacteroidetes bacterium]|nr:histone H1 [Fibrella sp.]